MKLLRILCLVLLLLPSMNAFSQELNAKVTINTQSLGPVDKEQFDELQKQLFDLLNNTRWTHTSFAPAERIDCNFTINLLSKKEPNKYTSELNVTATRPVFNSSYMTPLFIFRDRDVNFEYDQFARLEWNPQNMESNLLASVVFYVYAILTYDFDSFAELGGSPYASQMRQIVAAAQSKQDWQGWEAYKSDLNRYALSEALNDKQLESVRKAWYLYHRKGLDDMVDNIARGRNNIVESVSLLEEAHKAKPMSVLYNIFATTKLDEMGKIMSKTSESEKQELGRRLIKIFPTESDKIDKLKRAK